jgi:hypothetical protein
MEDEKDIIGELDKKNCFKKVHPYNYSSFISMDDCIIHQKLELVYLLPILSYLIE